jgi:hypothetical protein
MGARKDGLAARRHSRRSMRAILFQVVTLNEKGAAQDENSPIEQGIGFSFQMGSISTRTVDKAFRSLPLGEGQFSEHTRPGQSYDA